MDSKDPAESELPPLSHVRFSYAVGGASLCSPSRSPREGSPRRVGTPKVTMVAMISSDTTEDRSPILTQEVEMVGELSSAAERPTPVVVWIPSPSPMQVSQVVTPAQEDAASRIQTTSLPPQEAARVLPLETCVQPHTADRQEASVEEVVAFGGIPYPTSGGRRTSRRIQEQPDADDFQMGRAMRAAKIRDVEAVSGHLQSVYMDPYVVLAEPYGPQGAHGYWVQPMRNGCTGYIKPIWMAVQ
ncbi:uncharacterized protein [Triticum aestivum]|uniref:uncharacterized protein n=1 Tax=Triticum aestivum TaxID=4565 RepID=UPI001D02584E|nr:uncharacterized protein LOC123170061 [Triticum aestivum]